MATTLFDVISYYNGVITEDISWTGTFRVEFPTMADKGMFNWALRQAWPDVTVDNMNGTASMVLSVITGRTAHA